MKIDQGRLKVILSSAVEVLEEVAVLALVEEERGAAVECLGLFLMQMEYELERLVSSCSS